MITVKLNKRDFEYDIHSLVKAFYPREEVRVRCEEQTEEAILKISVFYEENRIRSVILDAEGKLLLDGASPIRQDMDRIEIKNVLKKLLYSQMKKLTGTSLPWGDLTGIRPTRIPMNLLEGGYEDAQILSLLEQEYLVSHQKAALALSIAKRERALLEKIDARSGYSLYVGIPFCPSICLYCSFSSSPISMWKNRVDEYLEALFREMAASKAYFQDKRLQTVYIGGGTPTTLTPDQLDRLLGQIEKNFDLSHVLEYTVEAGRPDSITREKLQVLRKHGISRISINPQTMNQKTLDVIGRIHTVERIRESFMLARELGFDNINMDLIVGLPLEGEAEVKRTLEQIGELDPESVTVHSLALKRATRLNLMKDLYQDISFENSDRIMDLCAASNASRGLYPYYLYRQKNMAGNYENVGYAREGAEGVYNILIMEEIQSILALGAGASTKIVTGPSPCRIERIENVKDIQNYIERIDEMILRKRKIYEYTTDHDARTPLL